MFNMLVVDDNVADRKGIIGLVPWETLGIRVAGSAANGMEGLEKALELRPDFVLTDVAMPLMDGIDMTRQIKEHLPHVKFIFMSCFDEFEYVRNALDLEVCSYVLKPIKLPELTEAVAKMVGIRQEELARSRYEDDLKLQLKESIPLLQEQFIRDLLYGKLAEEKDIMERMQYLGIDLHQKLYTVIFIKIDNYELNYGNVAVEQKYLLIHKVKQFVHETLLGENMGYVTGQQVNSLAVIIFCSSGSEEDFLNKVLESLQNCRQLVNDRLHSGITIGVGNLSKDLQKIPSIFESAEYAAKSRFYSGGNRIILASEVSEPDRDASYDLNVLKKEIENVLESGNTDTLGDFLDKYFSVQEKHPEGYVKSLTVAIISILQVILTDRNESFQSVFGNETLVWEKLFRFETIVDIRQWLTNILQAERDFLKRKDTHRYEKIIEDIKRIIHEKYAEVENVNQITDPLFISAGHANFIFKQHTGKTIFDYLIEVRMEEAKRLMKDPYCKIYEVSERVGYRSTTYFSTIFKDYTGMVPKEYRDKSGVKK